MLKREQCDHTKHDSRFSHWKVHILSSKLLILFSVCDVCFMLMLQNFRNLLKIVRVLFTLFGFLFL